MMVMYQTVPDFPIVLAANRDEYYDRVAQGPGVLSQAPDVWGGRDTKAGGTWLGVNEYGLVVGLTNRRMQEDQETASDRHSRGLLCMDALQYAHAAETTTFLASEPPDRYNPFNLLVLDRHVALYIAYEGKPAIRPLDPGLHILANQDVNDTKSDRIRRARQLVGDAESVRIEQVMPRLERVCRDHDADIQDGQSICIHRHDNLYGTVSSTLLALSTQRHKSIYRYAHCHPCRTSYQDYSSYLTAHGVRRYWSIPAV